MGALGFEIAIFGIALTWMVISVLRFLERLEKVLGEIEKTLKMQRIAQGYQGNSLVVKHWPIADAVLINPNRPHLRHANTN